MNKIKEITFMVGRFVQGFDLYVLSENELVVGKTHEDVPAVRFNVDGNFFDNVFEIVGKWNNEYLEQASDGTIWAVMMTDAVGKKYYSQGDNTYPDNYNELIKLLSDATGGLAAKHYIETVV